jgi:hypothetical protein
MAKPVQKILFFHWYTCRDYENESPFRNQKRRFAERRKADKVAQRTTGLQRTVKPTLPPSATP